MEKCESGGEIHVYPYPVPHKEKLMKLSASEASRKNFRQYFLFPCWIMVLQRYWYRGTPFHYWYVKWLYSPINVMFPFFTSVQNKRITLSVNATWWLWPGRVLHWGIGKCKLTVYFLVHALSTLLRFVSTSLPNMFPFQCPRNVYIEDGKPCNNETVCSSIRSFSLL